MKHLSIPALLMALSFAAGTSSAGERLRIGTYNAQFLPSIPGSTEDGCCEDLFGGSARTRAQKISERILALQYDIIALNEVFIDEAENAFVEFLQLEYPFILVRVSDGDPFHQDSGLMLFSKYPFETLSANSFPAEHAIVKYWPDPAVPFDRERSLVQTIDATDSRAAEHAAFLEYADFDACTSSDCLADKGVAHVRIRNPDSERIYNVFLTHLQAARGRPIRAVQLQLIRTLMEDVLSPEQLRTEDVFLLGDMNIDGNPSGDREEWDESFGPSATRAGGFFANTLRDVWEFEMTPLPAALEPFRDAGATSGIDSIQSDVFGGGTEWPDWTANWIAFGNIDGDAGDEVGVCVSDGSGRDRFFIFDDEASNFAQLHAHLGSFTSIAFGDFDGDGMDEIGVTANADEGQPRWFIFDDQAHGFALITSGGSGWGDDNDGTRIAFGNVDDDPSEEAGITRNGPSSSPRFFIVDSGASDRDIFEGGNDSMGDAIAIAFGNIDSDPRDEVAVLRDADEGRARVFIFDDGVAGHASLHGFGSGWGSGNDATGVAFGNVDGDAFDEIGVTRRGPEGSPRFYIFDDQAAGFATLHTGGEGWGTDNFPTSIAFGDVDGDGRAEIGITRRGPEESPRFFVLGDRTTGFDTLHTGGHAWGESNFPRAAAFGEVNGDGKAEIGIARGGPSGSARFFIFGEEAFYSQPPRWKRLDYVLRNRPEQPQPLSLQHMAVAYGLRSGTPILPSAFGEAGNQDLSDHYGVIAEFDLAAPHSSPLTARVNPISDAWFHERIERQGGVQWYRFDTPGTYTVSIEPDGLVPAGFEPVFELYQSTQLSSPVPRLGGDGPTWTYHVDQGALYVKAFSRDRSSTGPYRIMFHRHAGICADDAIVLHPNQTQTHSLTGDRHKWFRIRTERPDNGAAQALRFFAVAASADPIVLELWSESFSLIATGSATSGIVRNNAADNDSTFFLTARRTGGSGSGAVEIGWETDLNVLHGTPELPLKLQAILQTSDEVGIGEDDDSVHITVTADDTNVVNSVNLGDFDDGQIRGLSDVIVTPIRFRTSMEVRLREEDTLSDDHLVGSEPPTPLTRAGPDIRRIIISGDGGRYHLTANVSRGMRFAFPSRMPTCSLPAALVPGVTGTLDGGGGSSAGGGWTITGTIGQIDAGVVRGADRILEGGFWGAAKGALLLSISGTVRDREGRPLPSVVMTLSGTSAQTTTTDAGGAYAFVGLSFGGTYTVTPSAPFCTFEPDSRTFTELKTAATADFTATCTDVLAPIVLQGRLLDEIGNPISDATVILTGTVNASMQTGAKGEFRFSNLPGGGTYRVQPFKHDVLFTPADQTFAEVQGDTTADFTAQPAEFVDPKVTDATQSSGIELRLNQLFYQSGELVTATLDLGTFASDAAHIGIVLASPRSGDIETLTLARSGDGRQFATLNSIPTGQFVSADAVTHFDGRLTVRPNEIFFAVWYLNGLKAGGPRPTEQIVSDFGIGHEPNFPQAPMEIMPDLAMTEDERQVPEGGKRIGTLLAEGDLPVQLPVNELVLFPTSDRQLQQFLQETGGQVIMTDVLPNENVQPASYLIQIDPAQARVENLPQMRLLFGQTEKLFASNEDVLRIFALALHYLMEGYRVAVNPRLHFAGQPTISAVERGNVTGTMANRGPLNIPKLWAFMALWDADLNTVPMGILDMGFAPNPDYRVPPGGMIECDMEGAIITGSILRGFDCGPGVAVGPPTVGNSFFGGRSWHGSGVVTTAGGIINNGWGSAGTGGQVVVPMLYRFGTASYAFEIGLGIRKAAADGASVINISAGYPCRLINFVAPERICGTAERAAFCAVITAELAAVAALICGSIAPLAAIPIVGPILAAAATVACGVATTAVVVASAACFSTLIAGDVRGAMESGVAFATERGVPVVTIAGNRFEREDLPVIIRDIVDLRDQRTERWEIIPAMIPETIVVGATADNWPFANQHFFGSRVDIWAPIRSSYMAPPDTSRVTPPETHEWDSIGGTSAATPFVAGVVAAMQSINPSLNPLTPGLTSEQRRMIPARIKNILTNTAWTTMELEAMAPPEMFTITVDAATQRRNLINPFRAIQSAATGLIPDLTALGYPDTLDFDEVNALTGADVPPRFSGSVVLRYPAGTNLVRLSGAFFTATDVGKKILLQNGIETTILSVASSTEATVAHNATSSALDVPFWITTARTLRVGDIHNGTIIAIRGEGGAPTLTDSDWFQYQISALPGIYRAQARLIVPSGFGTLIAGPSGEYSTTLVTTGAVEDEFLIAGPPMFSGAFGAFRIFHPLGQDNVYKLELLPPLRVGDLPIADRFDRNDTAVNPPESRPNNNIRTRSVHLGGDGEFAWELVDSTAAGNTYEISIAGLNFHELNDTNWFAIVNLPPFTAPPELPGCQPELEIQFAAGMVVSIFIGTEVVVNRASSPVRLPHGLASTPLHLRFEPSPRGTVVHYDLRLIFRTANERICELGSRIPRERGFIHTIGGARTIGFPRFLPDRVSFGPGEFEGLPPRMTDPAGRITTPDSYLIGWTGTGPFNSAFELIDGTSLRVRLLTLEGNVIATAFTPDLESALGLMAANPDPATADLQQLGSNSILPLSVDNLPPGDYLLEFSHATPGTRINGILPRGATRDGSMTYEDLLGFPPPQPAVLRAVVTGDQLTLSWPVTPVPLQLETTTDLGSEQWTPVTQPADASTGQNVLSIKIANDQQFFRLRSAP